MRLLLAVSLALATPGFAAPPANPQIDYAGFQLLTRDVGQYRQARLLGWNEFAAAARRPGVLLLDARSADAYRAGHIKGAVNLPFTDFTAESLAKVIGDKERPILIYCNNNFRNDRAPVQMKLAQVALNIQTFINLVGYGYANVHELGETVDFNDPKVGWVRSGKVAAR